MDTNTKEILDPQGREGETIPVFKVGDKVRLLEAGTDYDVGTVTWCGKRHGAHWVEVDWPAVDGLAVHAAHQLASARHPIVLGCNATTSDQEHRVATVYHLAGGQGSEPVVGLYWPDGSTTKHHPGEVMVLSGSPTPNATRLERRGGTWQIGRYGPDTLKLPAVASKASDAEHATCWLCDGLGASDRPDVPCKPCWGTGYEPPLFGFQVVARDTGEPLGPVIGEPEAAAQALAVANELCESMGLAELVDAAAPGGLRLSEWQRARLDSAS